MLLVLASAADAELEDDVLLLPRRLAIAAKLSKIFTVESLTLVLIDKLGTDTLIVFEYVGDLALLVSVIFDMLLLFEDLWSSIDGVGVEGRSLSAIDSSDSS